MTPTQIIVALSVGFTFLWAIALLLLKNQITHVLTEVRRMPNEKWFDEVNTRVKALPDQDWFDEVRMAIRRMPDPERLGEHYARVHQLANSVNSLSIEGGNLKAEIQDIKVVLRQTVDRASKNEGRLDAMDRSVGSRRGTDGGGGQ